MARDVFICHAHDDRQAAMSISKALKAKNVTSWGTDIPTPRFYLNPLNVSVRDEIRSSRLVILVCSTQTNTSSIVMAQLEYASSQGQIVVPFKLDRSKPHEACVIFSGYPIGPEPCDLGQFVEWIAEFIRDLPPPELAEDSPGARKNSATTTHEAGTMNLDVAGWTETCEPLGSDDDDAGSILDKVMSSKLRVNINYCLDFLESYGQPEEAPVWNTIHDQVHFALSCPAMMVPSRDYVLDVWAFMEEHREALNEAIEKGLRGADPYVKFKGPNLITQGSTVTVRLKIVDLLPEPVEDAFVWLGGMANASFPISIPKDADHKSYPGVAAIFLDSRRIARLDFTIEVGEHASGYSMTKLKPHHSAFASYSRADTNDVVGRIQGMKKTTPWLDIFFDRASLRSGDDWKQRLHDEIVSRDVFYLFWSRAASESAQVREEWQCALKEKGIETIDPVPLVPRDDAPPPEELESLHFDDWMLAYQRLEQTS